MPLGSASKMAIARTPSVAREWGSSRERMRVLGNTVRNGVDDAGSACVAAIDLRTTSQDPPL
jgi:hypothetical protein